MPVETLPERVVLFGLAATPSTLSILDDVRVTCVEYPTLLVPSGEHRIDERLVLLAATDVRSDQWLSTSDDARFR